MLIPWSRFWERNYFADIAPVVRAVITNNYVRGAVSGLGIVNIWIAVAELGAILGRRDEPAVSPGHDG